MNREEYERAVQVLLKHPGIAFARGLSLLLERDPGYLTGHQRVITQGVRGLLEDEDIHWSEQILADNAIQLIREAIERLREPHFV